MIRSLAARVDAATPADRNRYADLLRVGAIAVVVLGHWLIAVVSQLDGEPHATHLFTEVPATRWLTWLFQVMPLFFFVGGYANASGWSSARARGVRPAAWVRSRAARLLTPVAPLLLLWIPATPLLVAAGVRGDLVRLATQAALVPAWFLAVYLVIVALVPLTTALHRRWGVHVLAALAAVAVLSDALHLAGVPLVGWSSYLWVWGAVHQAGYLWHDGTLRLRRRSGFVLAAAGVALLALLSGVLGYPVSMVGVEGATRSNTTPPSVAILALALAQVGLISIAREPAERLLARPWAWAGVVLAGGVTMTVYLWHMTVLVLVSGLAAVTGLLPTTPVGASWWATRPLWYAALVLASVPVVALAAPVERGSHRRRLANWAPSALATAAAVLATAAGIGLLAGGGLWQPGAPAGLPATSLALVAAGFAVLVLPPLVRRPGPRRWSSGLGHREAGDRQVEPSHLAPVGDFAPPLLRQRLDEQQPPSRGGLE